MKHTKGDWEVTYSKWVKINTDKPQPDKIVDGVGVELSEGYYRVIADSILPENDAEYLKEFEETEANFNLIAAAPKLLEFAIKTAKEEGWATAYNVVSEALGRAISFDEMNELYESINSK